MARHAKQSRTIRRAAVLSTVLAVLTGYGTWAVVDVAYAASLTGSSFEIDTNANLVVDAGGIDWTSASGVLTQADLASGSGDDSFTQGTHEDSDVPTTDDGSIPPSKSDLKSFGLFTEKAAGATFLNVYWTRVQDPSGTTNMDFEFNQSAVKKNDPSGSAQIIPVRTAGDLLLTYDLTNGGSVATISKRFWSGSDWGPETALSSADAIGSVNASAISAANSNGLGSLDPRTFGEASVDLAALLPVSDGCVTYGSAYLKSRSSASFNAELKDFITPLAATISNCGAVKVHKTDADGPLADAGFTLYKDAVPVGGSRGAEDTVAAGTCSTDGAGDCTISDVKKGDYWLVETTVPAGHDGVAPQHVSITAGDQVVSLNLDDPIQTGTIIVVKDAQPNDAQDFGFTFDGTAFTLDDDADPTRSSTQSFTVPVGSHTVTEDPSSGWTLTNVTCVNGSATPSVQNRSATVSLTKGQTVTCTFINVAVPVGAQLSTTAVNEGGDAWNDNASLVGDGTHAVTGSVAFFACAPAATATACTSGGTQVGSAVTVTGSGSSYGASTSATYTAPTAGWTCFRAEYTSTSAFYSSSTHTNATSECFLTRWADLTVSTTATPAFGRAYTWTIDKDVDASSVSIPAGGTAVSTYTVTVGRTSADSAWTVSGNVTVTNPNPVDFTGVVVTDAIDNGGVCTVTGGASVTVPASSSASLPYSCTYAAAPSPATGTDTGTATWDAAAYFTLAGSASGTAGVDFGAVSPGLTDSSVDVTDTVVGDLGTVDALTDPNPKAFTYTVSRPGVAGTCTTYDNTAAFTTSDTETTGSSSASVAVCVGSDLTAEMTAAGSYDRQDLWAIDKDVDQTTVTLENGETATFHYTVTASPAGSSESGHEVHGTVTVTNPNDWESVVADVTVATDLGSGETCTVTGGDDLAVPAGESVEVAYACTYTGTPAHTGTAGVSVTWDGVLSSTPSSSVIASAAAALVLDAETNPTVTVTDDKTDPANPVVLGTADWADAPTSFEYDVVKAAAGSTCATYTNTAVLTETEQQATADVQVCGFTGGGGTIVVPPAQGGGLPFTGDRTGLLLQIAGGLLLGGALLLLVSRKRREA